MISSERDLHCPYPLQRAHYDVPVGDQSNQLAVVEFPTCLGWIVGSFAVPAET